MYLYVGREGHYCMYHINYDLFYLQSVVPLYIDMIKSKWYMQYKIPGELWRGFKSKALRSSTLYNATALDTPLYELVLLLVWNQFMLHAAFSYISYSLKHNLCCFTEGGVYIYVYFTIIILTFK